MTYEVMQGWHESEGGLSAATVCVPAIAPVCRWVQHWSESVTVAKYQPNGSEEGWNLDTENVTAIMEIIKILRVNLSDGALYLLPYHFSRYSISLSLSVPFQWDFPHVLTCLCVGLRHQAELRTPSPGWRGGSELRDTHKLYLKLD